jgi:hypothetical protein
VYLNPPERAAVFSFDEKIQVQALDRTRPSLPIKPGQTGTMTHNYERHGTTDLFAVGMSSRIGPSALNRFGPSAEVDGPPPSVPMWRLLRVRASSSCAFVSMR